MAKKMDGLATVRLNPTLAQQRQIRRAAAEAGIPMSRFALAAVVKAAEDTLRKASASRR